MMNIETTARGRFVVIEGIDGAGTTTQAKLLADHLWANGVRVHRTQEPSRGPVGSLIRQVLAGRIVVPGGRAPGWATMALLFAADRIDHVEAEIEPHLCAGKTVISDRYDASSLAYQSVTSGSRAGDSVAWIRAVNQQALRPDITIVLDVPAEVAAGRREARGEPAELYEHNELQRALCDFYRNLPALMPDDRVVVVDGVASPEAVLARVVEACARG